MAYRWLDYCARDIELDKYVRHFRSQHDLNDVEYDTIKTEIYKKIEEEVKEHGGSNKETHTFKIIEHLARNGIVRGEDMATYLGVEPKTFYIKMRPFKGLELIYSDNNGYRLTGKGIKFSKRWLDEVGELR